jgi:hypothetical protein
MSSTGTHGAPELVVPVPPPYKDSEGYRGHLLDQYKHFVDVTLQYWNHMATANQFFLSLHTVILSGFTYVLVSKADFPPLLLVVLTLLACGAALHWLLLLRSLRKINQVRHGIIQEWEMHLPARPYGVERDRLYPQGNSMNYLPIQKLYMLLPVLVILTYLGLAVLIALGFRFVDP